MKIYLLVNKNANSTSVDYLQSSLMDMGHTVLEYDGNIDNLINACPNAVVILPTDGDYPSEFTDSIFYVNSREGDAANAVMTKGTCPVYIYDDDSNEIFSVTKIAKYTDGWGTLLNDDSVYPNDFDFRIAEDSVKLHSEPTGPSGPLEFLGSCSEGGTYTDNRLLLLYGKL